VAPFNTTLSLLAPIRPTTVLTPGQTFRRDQPFRFEWTGGSPDALVYVRLATLFGGGQNGLNYCECTVRADTGFVQFEPVPIQIGGQTFYELPRLRGDAVVDVKVTPANPTVLQRDNDRVTATWSQEWKYTGMRIP